MSGLPWSKFFWSDYASDPALKLCSFAAQGLWMRMLCIAAEHDPPGYVAVNGNPLDHDGIARMTGGATEEVQTLVAELESNGVFNRDRRGWIYSRRQINESRKRAEASKWGKKGGNPSLRNHRDNSGTFKGQAKGVPKGDPKPQRPEARSQSSSVDKSTVADATPIDPLKMMFDLGRSVLGDAGIPDKQARSLIGKWKAKHGDGDVMAALVDARTKCIAQPVEWITKRLASRQQPNGRGDREPSYFEYLMRTGEYTKPPAEPREREQSG